MLGYTEVYRKLRDIPIAGEKEWYQPEPLELDLKLKPERKPCRLCKDPCNKDCPYFPPDTI